MGKRCSLYFYKSSRNFENIVSSSNYLGVCNINDMYAASNGLWKKSKDAHDTGLEKVKMISI